MTTKDVPARIRQVAALTGEPMKSGSELYYDQHCEIETQNGSFDPLRPTFDIGDIAGGLSRKCRFNGQCKRYYSVAQHSLMVAKLMKHVYGGNPLEGLLHDASEAYLPDVPSPYKHILPDLGALDWRVESALRERYKLPPKKSQECAQADMTALFIEADALLPSRGTGRLWAPIAQFRPEALRWSERFPVVFEDPTWVESAFMCSYYSLSGDNE